MTTDPKQVMQIINDYIEEYQPEVELDGLQNEKITDVLTHSYDVVEMSMEIEEKLEVKEEVIDLETWAVQFAQMSFGELANKVAQILNERESLASSESLDSSKSSRRGRSRAQPISVHPDVENIPAENYRIEAYPECQHIQQQLNEVPSLGIENPYFQVHDGLAINTTQVLGQTLINYANYNYLGLSGDARVTAAAKQAIDRYGTSVSASRLASGERPIHQELERELAYFIGVEACVVYISGHATNVTTIGHLLDAKDVVFYDDLSHNSIVQGCCLSGAKAIRFGHNDWASLEQLLQTHRPRYRRALIICEGVYSMDGDIPDLPRFIELKQRYKAMLMVDEAHSIGVLGQSGRGIGEFFNVDRTQVDLWMGTLSKSFASSGGYIAGSRILIDYLKYTAPGFVYSVGLSPANTAAALEALRILKAEPERVATLQERSQYFLTKAQSQGWNTGFSKDSPIIPIIVGESLLSGKLSHALFQKGINARPQIYPSVPEKSARLRFFISSTHTEDQIDQTIEALAAAFAESQQVPALVS